MVLFAVNILPARQSVASLETLLHTGKLTLSSREAGGVQRNNLGSSYVGAKKKVLSET